MDRDDAEVAHSADFPRAQVGANSQRLLAAIIADYSFDSERFSSTSITRILAEFGVTEAGARKALSRLTERNVLIRSREGRATFYQVSPANLAVRHQRLAKYLAFGEEVAPWDGSWTVVVFSVAERQRSARAALRSALSKLGFAPMADAVWVRHGDHRDSALHAASVIGAPVAVMSSRFTDGGGIDPRDAFDLDAIRTQYEALISRHEPVLARLRAGALTPQEAFVVRARLMDSWRSVVILDPDLPRELLPEDWPRFRARETFVELFEGLGPLALARLRSLVGESDPEGAQRLHSHARVTAWRQ